MSLLRCAHCRFSIRPRVQFLTLDYCPRCMAKRRVTEPLHVVDESRTAPIEAKPRASKASR